MNVTLGDFSPDLIYCDGPYGPVGLDKYFGVTPTIDTYVEWMLMRIRPVMKENRNLIVQCNSSCSHYLKVGLDKEGYKFQNEIVWCYSGPAKVKSKLPRKHDNLLWFTLGDNFVFNQPRAAHKTKLKYTSVSAWKTGNYDYKDKALEDWWIDIPSLQRNEKEKTGYPTQKPVQLMRRVVEIWSRRTVLDMFAGSGSMCVACHDRHYFGCDVNPNAIALIERRMLRNAEQSGT